MQELENNEARLKFIGSYKKKRVFVILINTWVIYIYI